MIETDKSFDDIRPLLDSEVPNAIEQLINDKSFRKAVEPIFKPLTWDQVAALLSQCKTKDDFQGKVISPVMEIIIEKTTTETIGLNWERIPENESNIFISNHRDIVLDAALFNILLFKRNMTTTEIAIGDNLLIYPWIENLVRLNKSFIVKRGVSVRQMLQVSKHLSEYINKTITERQQSVWLAHREGRAKDSNDKTQVSLIKMLTLYDNANPLQALKNINIIPLSISYEYDPCDYLKAKEFQLKRDNPQHKKSQSDDIENMYTGITGFKGKVHFKLGNSINPLLDKIPEKTIRKEVLNKVAKIIDKEIYLNYSFFPVNYIAYDMMSGEDKFKSEYSEHDIENFNKYLDTQIEKIEIPNKDNEYLRNKIILMYGNTVKNYLSAAQGL